MIYHKETVERFLKAEGELRMKLLNDFVKIYTFLISFNVMETFNFHDIFFPQLFPFFHHLLIQQSELVAREKNHSFNTIIYSSFHGF